MDRNPLVEFAEDEFWTSDDNALLALTGIYNGNILFNSPEYSPTDWWSYGGLIFLEFVTDNGYDRRGSNSNFHKISDGTLLPNNPYINQYWSNSYFKISRCNRFLEGIDKISAKPEVIDKLKAEARFIRATQYFYLSQFFHDVPLVVNTLTREEANVVTKNTQKEIVDFLIVEFTEAAKFLPRFKDLSSTEIGRASKQASLAFLGRTLLAEESYAEAAKVYEEIISYGDNAIDADYQSIFHPSNESSSENIFSMQYMQDMAGSAMPQHAYNLKNGGWCLINIASGLFESYQFKDGTPFSYESELYNPKKLGENRDPRLDYTMYYNSSIFKGTAYNCDPDGTSPDRIGSGQTTQTGFLMRKYFDESFNGNVNSYGGNIPIIRYAEVLLSYLEAQLEAGKAITPELLDQTINKVRGRLSVNMPPITETNSDKLRDILRNERRVELAMEGIRYWDLLRWKIAHKNLSGDIYGAPFLDAKRMNYKKEDGREIVDPHSRWYVNKRAFRKEQDYKWPIPQSEQDINPNLR
ncbi:glycan metabolism protein RagB [Bacteroidales bacterium]|nr:glycan metabolism protein RagB [Bacteroidales bacterium]